MERTLRNHTGTGGGWERIAAIFGIRYDIIQAVYFIRRRPRQNHFPPLDPAQTAIHFPLGPNRETVVGLLLHRMPCLAVLPHIHFPLQVARKEEEDQVCQDPEVRHRLRDLPQQVQQEDVRTGCQTHGLPRGGLVADWTIHHFDMNIIILHMYWIRCRSGYGRRLPINSNKQMQ